MSRPPEIPQPNPEYFDRKGGRSAEEVISGDLLVHNLAVSKFFEGKTPTRNERSFLTTGTTNAIAYAEMFGLVDGEMFGDKQIPFKSPRTSSYRQLIRLNRLEYEKIDRKVLRVVLGGINSVDVSDEQIEYDEMAILIKVARKKGVINLDDDIQLTERDLSSRSLNNLWIALISTGKGSIDNFEEKEKEAQEDPLIKKDIAQAALHKLACYMALVDQFTFNARALNQPISGRVKLPTDSEFMQGIAAEYGGEIPGLSDLYKMSFEVLQKYSKPNDPLLHDLLAQGPLPEDRFA